MCHLAQKVVNENDAVGAKIAGTSAVRWWWKTETIHLKVFVIMPSNNDDKEAAPKKNSFCQRNKSRNGSFVSTLRDQFHEFIHAPMDQRKTCLADTFQKMMNASKNFRKEGDSQK
ncbi:hypothetical protein PIB30_007175 [Stylosanthes scabra]|uniref:Uncharacterized protein n=1 Tax=Stylosanthes scabra TaxID=79078 RepID=A0ABU6U4S6_9FABA|nr:hypothetical protein [Stylosanthes scabra]